MTPVSINQSDFLFENHKRDSCPMPSEHECNNQVCVVADSPTPMLKYRHLLSEEYSHIVPLPCTFYMLQTCLQRIFVNWKV